MYESQEIFSRCSPSRVYAVVTGLTHEKKELVRQMGFGTLLGMKKCNLRRDLIFWLIERFDPVEGSLTIGNEKFTVSSHVFGKILGIEDGGEDLGDLIMDESCKRVTGERTSLTRLAEKIKNNDSEQMFVNHFVQFLCSTLLLPSTSLYVLRSLEESLRGITEAKVCRTKNWASISWRYLVEGVRRFKERRSHFISGCVYFFQLYYLNELEGHHRYVDKSVCPSNWWSEKEISIIFEWINDCGGFEKVSFRKKRNNELVQCNPLGDCISLPSTGIEDILSEVRSLRSKIDTVGVQLRQTITQEPRKSEQQSKGTFIEDNGGLHGNLHGIVVYSEECRMRESCEMFSMNTPFCNRLRVWYERFVESGGKVVGPFNLRTSLDLSVFFIAMHVFQSELSLSEVIFRHGNLEVVRLYFGTLLPQCKVDLQVVGAFVVTIRFEELMKYKAGRKGCVVTLPIKKRNGCLLDLAHIRQGDCSVPLSKCIKVLVPILDFDNDHWILAEFNKIDNCCGIWDSAGVRHCKTRLKILQELASAIDNEICLHEKPNVGNGRCYSTMNVKSFDDVQFQDNNTDCGVFVMKFIEASVSLEKVMRRFDPHAERLHIGLKIIATVHNEMWTEVSRAAQDHCLSLCGSLERGRVFVPKLSRIRSPSQSRAQLGLNTKKQRTAFWSRGRVRRPLRRDV